MCKPRLGCDVSRAFASCAERAARRSERSSWRSTMRRSCWLAVATMSALSDAQSECPKAVSIYAMQKTGSTFLGLFSRSVALRQQMCKVLQTTKEFVCETINYVDCPRNELHRKSVHLERGFAPPSRQALLAPSARQGWDCGEPELVGPKGHAQWRCKPDGGPQPGMGELRSRCNDQLRHEMFAAANGWLRSSTDVPKYRYNFSLSTLLSSSGFVRGPMRQLYTEVDARAVPFFGGYHNVVIVHTRHPVEMMVSAYFCISDPKVFTLTLTLTLTPTLTLTLTLTRTRTRTLALTLTLTRTLGTASRSR